MNTTHDPALEAATELDRRFHNRKVKKSGACPGCSHPEHNGSNRIEAASTALFETDGRTLKALAASDGATANATAERRVFDGLEAMTAKDRERVLADFE